MAAPGDQRPQSLIISIFGAYGRNIGGWLSVSALVSLLNDVGVDDPAVRSALSRFKRRGVLLSENIMGLLVMHLASPPGALSMSEMLECCNAGLLPQRRLGTHGFFNSRKQT